MSILNQWIPIFIGFLSILLTFFILKENHKHNKLSVQPYPDISAYNYTNKISVILENKGVGPYIVKSFRVLKYEKIKNNIIDWMPILPNDIRYSDFKRDFEKTAILPGESFVLLEFSLDEKDERQRQVRDKIKSALSELAIEFDYTGFYDKKIKYFALHSLSNVFAEEPKTRYPL